MILELHCIHFSRKHQRNRTKKKPATQTNSKTHPTVGALQNLLRSSHEELLISHPKHAFEEIPVGNILVQ